MDDSVWYTPPARGAAFYVLGGIAIALGAVVGIADPSPQTGIPAVFFALLGVWLIVRGPRTALGANGAGFALHTMGRSRFVPWCHIADLRVDHVGSHEARMIAVVVGLTDGKRVELAAGTAAHGRTDKSRTRTAEKAYALQQIREAHRCSGTCARETWYIGHIPPSMRPQSP